MSDAAERQNAEAMRAKCELEIRQAIEQWEETMHTDDGDLYAEALAALKVLRPVRDAIVVLKDTALDTKDK